MGSRFKRAWNTFFNRDPTHSYNDTGPGYFYRPDRTRFSRGNERSIVTSVYNRISLDGAAISIQHVRLDENERYISNISSKLNNCLTLEANLDQTARAFRQDVIMSMLDEGCIAIVPVETTDNPEETGGYDILSMRVGKILEWYAPPSTTVKGVRSTAWCLITASILSLGVIVSMDSSSHNCFVLHNILGLLCVSCLYYTIVSIRSIVL